MPYYDWGKTLSHSNTAIFLVISSRGFGKTYGMRKTAINSFLKDGSNFVEVVRYKSELADVQNEYFSKLELNNEFPNHVFKVHGNSGYIAEKPKTEDEKPNWKHLCYFVALSGQQKAKKRTFANVRYMIFDEFLISNNTFPGYLRNEYGEFLNLFDSIAREIPGQGTKLKAVLLGNSCNLVNPYFAAFGINKEPSYGYHFYNGKMVLLHYVEPGEYGELKKETTVGKLARNTTAASVMLENKFDDANDSYIGKKPKNAKFDFGMIYRGQQFGIWLDEIESYYYVTPKIPNGTNRPVFSLTTPDNRPNFIILNKSDKRLKSFLNLYYMGIVRYETPALREKFFKALTVFGIR